MDYSDHYGNLIDETSLVWRGWSTAQINEYLGEPATTQAGLRYWPTDITSRAEVGHHPLSSIVSERTDANRVFMMSHRPSIRGDAARAMKAGRTKLNVQYCRFKNWPSHEAEEAYYIHVADNLRASRLADRC